MAEIESRKRGRPHMVSTRVSTDETHLPAQQDQARPDSRISCSHGHEGGPPDYQAAPRQRPCTPDTVTRRLLPSIVPFCLDLKRRLFVP